jgi:FlaG/FlaF family flagellin (archaellin)
MQLITMLNTRRIGMDFRKILTFVLVIAMCASMFTAVAVAKPDNRMNADRGNMSPNNTSVPDDVPGRNLEMNTDRGNMNPGNIPYPEVSARDKVPGQRERMKNNYDNSRQDLLNVKERVQKGQISANSEEFFNVSSVYLNDTINYMITRLSDTKEDFENKGVPEDSIERIDEYIGQLEDQQEKLEVAEDRKELAEIARDVRKIWHDVSKDLYKFRSLNVLNGVGNYIDKADSISERIESEIERLNGSGVDTTEVELMLERYNTLIENASEYREMALDAEQDSSESLAYMQQSVDATRQANDVLRNILEFLKDHRQGFANLSEDTNVSANGNGTAVISGNFDINLSATDAKLVVKDLAGDATIEMDGEYERITPEESMGRGTPATVYLDFTGDAHINGSRLTMMVSGENISIDATGTGSTVFTGEGTYTTDSDTMQWAGTYSAEDEDFYDEEDVEIEVEIEGEQSEVKIKLNETEDEFTLNTTDLNEIIAEIGNRTSLTAEQIEQYMEIDEDEDSVNSTMNDEVGEE